MTPSLDALLDLHGTTAIVTGGAKGIGKGIAARLHEAGAAVVIADLDLDAARTTTAEFEALRPGSAMAQQTDVSNAASVDAMVRDTVERFGGIDVLVNNAGIFPAVPLAEMTENDFMKVIGVNLDGVILALFGGVLSCREVAVCGSTMRIRDSGAAWPLRVLLRRLGVFWTPWTTCPASRRPVVRQWLKALQPSPVPDLNHEISRGDPGAAFRSGLGGYGAPSTSR